MPDKLCSFTREYVMFIFTKSLSFYHVDYSILRNEKRHLDLISLAIVEGAQGK